MLKNLKNQEKYIAVIVFVIALVGLGIGGYFGYITAKKVAQNTTDIESEVMKLSDQNVALINALRKEQLKNQEFGDQIGAISKTVGTLDKLSKTDKELLQKYSKVYFLNENYVPSSLTKIAPDYIFNKNREEKIHSQVYPFLQDMITNAQKDGVDLKIISAYRSFGEQSALKGNYIVTYGSGANKFSADQGFSEHQLGSTIDLTTPDLGSGYIKFGNSEAFVWMRDNAHKYGFILSYSEGNTFYQYEPWHWRFVGKSLANMLREEKLNFYDLDQRRIDPYLIKIFD
jgi:LAS superfamily LD-carboxypeptidase LdcB